MPTARMPGRNTERVGRGAQQVPGGDGRMWIMGPTPGTLHSQGRLEGEDPAPGRNTLQACCECGASWAGHLLSMAPVAGEHQQEIA